MTGRWLAPRIVVEGLRPDAGGPEAGIRRRRLRDWTAPLALANQHFVAPSLYVNLREAGALDDLPAEAVDYLALLREGNEARNAALRRQAVELLGALQRAGLSPMLLKGGISLFLDHYRDPGERMIRDIDVQVPAATAHRALAALRELGYQVANKYPPGHNAYAEFMRPHDPGAVDLHFQLVDAPYLLPASEMRRRAAAVDRDGLQFLVPAPTDRVLHSLLHAQVHYLGNYYRGVLELRQLHEFATLARYLGDAVDWDFIAARMERHRLGVPLQSYLLAAERLLGLRSPLCRRAGGAAAWHYRRCVAQLHLRPLAWLAIPWGNLRACFARHRLASLYRTDAGPLPLPLRHAWQYLGKNDVRAAVGRLFRIR